MKKTLLLLLAISFFSCDLEQKKETSLIDQTLYKKYDLKKADELVISAFSNSDIVILGENHYIAEQVKFVADLIPKLHENGINTLYSEFSFRDDAKQIEALINADYFDEQLAKNLLVSGSGYYWMYQEYIELYRSAWKLNKTIKKGRKFRVIGLALGRDYNAIQKPEDWDNREKRMAYFREGEDAWAERVISETTKKGEKALVYCGYNHALTFYRQPYVENGKFIRLLGQERVGQHIYEQLKQKCSFILLHNSWRPKRNDEAPPIIPLNGKLDRLTDSLQKDKSYGFFTEKSSLGSIIDTTSYYSWGYPDFTLSDLCDGYIVVDPICDLNLCKPIPNFIDATNINLAKPQIKLFESIDNISILEANKLLEKGYQEQLKEFENEKKKMNCIPIE